MSYPEGVNQGVNLGRLKGKRHCKCSGIVIHELFLSQLSDNIPKALALEAACVRLLTPSFP